MNDGSNPGQTTARSARDVTDAALTAFENLTIGPQDSSKERRSASRTSTGHGIPTLDARTNSPSQASVLRRTSSSFKPPTSISSPEPHKRLSMSSLKGGGEGGGGGGGGAQASGSPRPSSSRRTSEQVPIRPVSSLSFASTVLPEHAPPPQPRTAATVGASYFSKELERHAEALEDTETVVIIHEACYGHRFSRPRTSKSSLGMIVERPERITAAVLGLSTAYVRLGSRHDGGLHAPVPDAVSGVAPPFVVKRSTREVGLLSPQVVAVHGKDWMGELQSMCLAAGARLALDGKELLRAKRVDAAGKTVDAQPFHEGDLYLCAGSLDALQGAVGGVCDAVDAVFSGTLIRRAFVAVRPPGHHCSADFPSGFCWLNNVHVGIQYAAQKHGLTHAVILDFDLHHGDGSQTITWDLNDKSAGMPKNAPHHQKISIGYYSLHDINSYPCEMGDKEKVQNASLCIDNAHGQSIWNVHLEPWTTEDDFNRLYENKYRVILDKARAYLSSQTARIKASLKGGKPKSAVFISAGFDASEWEGAGMQRHAVNVPTSFYERFTRDAVELAAGIGTSAEGRVISVLEGGYSNRALTSGVLSHVSGLCQQSSATANGLQTHEGDLDSVADAGRTVQATNHRWWSKEALIALEEYDAPPPAPVAVRKSQKSHMPTFASPTESFTQKVVDPEKFYRSMSGTVRPLPEIPIDLSIPSVDWVAASHALCKLLIPTHRTTTSCKPEELAAPRVKKQRQSMEPAATAATSRQSGDARQLRDRKAKVTAAENDAAAATEKPRRTTRRSSAASSLELVPQEGPIPAVPTIPDGFQIKSTPAATTPKQAAPAVRRKKSPAKARSASSAKLSAADSAGASNASAQASAAAHREASATPSLVTESTGDSFDTAPSQPGVPSQPQPSVHGDAGVASLTSGLKRITLKVGTREEHDRKAAERMAGEALSADAAEKKREGEHMVTTSPEQGRRGQDQRKEPVPRKPRKLAPSKTKTFESKAAGCAPPLPPQPETAPKPQPLTVRPAGVASSVVAPEPTSRPGSSHHRLSGGERTTAFPTPGSRSGTPAPAVVPQQDLIGAPIANVIAAETAAMRDQGSAPHHHHHHHHHHDDANPDLFSTVPRSGQDLAKDADSTTSRLQEHGDPARLPVFTSTGNIPFGPSPANPAFAPATTVTRDVGFAAAPDTLMGLPSVLDVDMDGVETSLGGEGGGGGGGKG